MAREGRRPRIGLLGGSFNPAHDGHRHISRLALDRLGLDRVWWLVSPQNPLKPVAGMAPLAERLARARRLARHPRLVISDLERELGTQYTVETLLALRRRLPKVAFVWLMGADNLVDISRWRRWPTLFHTVPIAIFDRPTYSLKALTSSAARRFARFRVYGELDAFADRAPPAWAFVRARLHAESATMIRRGGDWPPSGTELGGRGSPNKGE